MSGLLKLSLSGMIVILAQTAFSVTRLNDSSEEQSLKTQEQEEGAAPSTGQDYALKVGIGKPTFSDLKYYEDFYGSTSLWFNMTVNWNYLSSDNLSLGLGGSLGFYNAGGHQMKAPETDNPDNFEKTGGKLSLTLIPWQFLFTGSYRPFARQSFISLGFWAGYEELFFQEVRSDDSSSTASKTSSTPSEKKSVLWGATPSKSSETSSSQRVINTGWNSSLVLGASLDFLLNPLDEKNIRSMRRTTGLGGIYISPFFETTMSMDGRAYVAGKKTAKVSFAHQTYGVAFNFTTTF